MQKFIIAVCFLFASLSLQAQTSNTLGEVDAMIKAGLREHYDQITAGARNLSNIERDLLYAKHKRSSASYTLGNMFLGPFAIGSMIQGDPLGFVAAGINVGVIVFGFSSNDRDRALESIGIVYGVWFASFFLPSIYSYRHNSKLEEALLLNGISAIWVTPEIGRLPDGTPRAKVTVNVGF